MNRSTMKLFVIVAIMAACNSAAPTDELPHPSQVNPDVLLTKKPNEKIILITDPKEIAKLKRETKPPFYPTVLPKEHDYYVGNSDRMPPVKKRDIPVPLVAKNYHHEESLRGELENSFNTTSSSTEGNLNPQILTAVLNNAANLNEKHTSAINQQHRRETATPLLSRSESLENKEKSQPPPSDSHTHLIAEEYHIPLSQKNYQLSVQILPQNSSKSLRVENLNAHNKENTKPTDIENPPTSSIHQEKRNAEVIKNGSDDKMADVNENTSTHTHMGYLSESKVEDHKFYTPNDNTNIHDFKTSTTGHPLVRQRPVSVSELFSRPRDN